MSKHLIHSVVLLAWALPVLADAPRDGFPEPATAPTLLTWNLTAGYHATDRDPWRDFAHRLGARFSLPGATPGGSFSTPMKTSGDAAKPALARHDSDEQGAHGASKRRHLNAMALLLFWKASAGTR